MINGTRMQIVKGREANTTQTLRCMHAEGTNTVKVKVASDAASFQSAVLDPIAKGRKLSVLALVGAGISPIASSANPHSNGTSEADDNVWRNLSFIDLATLDAFDSNPALVWLYYAYRRHEALRSIPTEGHRILAQLSESSRSSSSKFNLLTITQNMDGLHQRANHDESALLEFHGSLFKVKCTNFMCSYNDYIFDDPLTPSLDVSHYEDPTSPLPHITSIEQLPLCPVCATHNEQSLLRPGVIWFGESLPLYLIDKADEFIMDNHVDILLVIGTSHTVWPTSSYIDLVKNQGGQIAVFNTVRDGEIDNYSNTSDTKVWQFIGDCSERLPEIFGPIIETLNLSGK
jgi:NAD+-dependent protein deacetylase sirtuin 5